MGAWKFIENRIWRVKERGYDLRHAARVESGSPATGSKTVHDQELADLMDETFVGFLVAGFRFSRVRGRGSLTTHRAPARVMRP